MAEERTVEVNGVRLTKAQLESALALINQPTLTHLTRLRTRCGKDKGVLLTGFVQQTYIDGIGFGRSYKFTVTREDGGTWSFQTQEELLTFWEVDE